ncbi:alanine--tRNA ligase [Actinoallomurus iriomotensis]|uniref:Alanine--tRNA ligase n=1 Tax=Actinoallomurus iriomotensis TaxID=478107 RepID=A0A9W6SGG8_9ACTN|nr:alanine--tRNA ligase [Actinoallomurus iriomotensis]GLY92477.1 alanine--tRNA ligase [Actinoallomurus iriomotensis]
MSATDGDTIRETFLRFFERNGHRRIEGASLVPVGDPTLLFVNSGMAPLKRYFTGEKVPPAPDLCDVQGCVRTKDIDDVGDRHHITYFEMLGSWSIGHYFKERAVDLAYALLTGDFGLDPRRLYVSVFGGDEALGLPPDEESARAWERAGVPRDRIVALPAEDNFWGPAGQSGPCGPCTEVFLDTGEEFGPAYVPGGVFDTKRRYIEIWNAGVFMQFDKGLDGVLRPLPFTSVDTGSGLERMELALNGLDSVYDTSLFAPLVRTVQDVLGETGEVLHHHRVIADHLRAAVAIMSDGVRPGNEGRGYIPRRLIRKCVTLAMGRHRERLDVAPIVDTVVRSLGPTYPRMAAEQAAVTAAIAEERDEFGDTVRRGLDQLDRVVARHGRVSGTDAFHLFATYGLPVEITRDLAAARGVSLDREEFYEALRRHRELSRGTRTDRRLRVDDVLPAAVASRPATEFLGYDTLSAEATVLTLFSDGTTAEAVAAGSDADLIVDRTPFYGEGGGQVGDRGTVRVVGRDGVLGDVTETVVHASGGHLHRVSVRSGVLRVGDTVTLTVDPSSRADTAANHTATHLLNAALRTVLGPHVRQAGSLVEPRRLRFDFTHPGPPAPEELAAVERLVNEWILTDAPRRVEVMPAEEAKASGAVSLEGEDYGEAVRVLSFGDFSKELCGGTHVEHTSQLGSFRIVSEQSVAAGVRRVVAVTRRRAVDHSIEQGAALSDVAATLRTSPKDVVPAARRLVAAARTPKTARDTATLANAVETVVDDVPVMLAQAGGTVGALREQARRTAGERDRVVVLWTTSEEKNTLVVSVPASLADRLRADALVESATRRLGGGGGGNARIAQGGLTTAPTTESLIEVLHAQRPASVGETGTSK